MTAKTIKRTGGGQFDPTNRNIFFSAGGFSDKSQLPEYFLVAVNDLPKKGYEAVLDQYIEAGHKIFLDSGIFNLTNEHKRATGCTMDEALQLAPEDILGFDELFKQYVDITTRYGDQLWGYIELDQGGALNKRKTRAKLEDLGLRPIPVYHPLVDGWEYFDELAEQYDRMCFGNIVQANMPTRVRLLHTLWERHRKYPELWVHVLGMTASEWALPLPPDSCDSSTWINGLRYPKIDMGYSMMKRQGSCGSDFLYVRDDDERDMYAAQRVYRDEMESANDQWAEARARALDAFGPVAMPQPNPKEGMKQ